MKQGLTEIICVIDKSGSMEPLAAEAISGFNQFIEEQKKVPGEAKLTLTLFDTNFEIVHNGAPLNKVPKLNKKTYCTGGMTALLDAVGKTIDEVGARLEKTPEEERPEKVMMVILTDGEENSSHEYTGARVPDMIKHQREKYNWEFMYLGANVDAFKNAKALNIDPGMAVNYAATLAGTASAAATYSRAVRKYRTLGNAPDSSSDKPIN